MLQAKELFEELASAGFTPDFEAYSSLIRGHCAVGNIEQALTYFNAAKQQRILPDVMLFNVLLGACASRNMLGIAEELVTDMEALGVQPTGNTLAALVRLYGARGQLSRAVEVFADFPCKHGIEPDSSAYHALVTACLSAGQVGLALEAFNKMSSAGCIASARTYEALIANCSRRGELADATNLVVDALGLRPLTAAPSSDTEAEAEAPQRRALVETQVVEELLRLVGRRGEAVQLGVPLLTRLQEAGFEISERVASGVRRAADAHQPASPAAETKQQASLQARREARGEEWARWRCGFSR